MSKQIKITFKGIDYTLEFTRRSVTELEAAGFRINDVVDKPISGVPALFAGAFRANHKYLDRRVIDEIYDSITERKELVNKLVESYVEPLNALMDDPQVDDEKKATWGANW